jgi:hypothetical protein
MDLHHLSVAQGYIIQIDSVAVKDVMGREERA